MSWAQSFKNSAPLLIAGSVIRALTSEIQSENCFFTALPSDARWWLCPTGTGLVDLKGHAQKLGA